MRKMDKMEKSIALQSMRWSWGFGIISLAIYSIYLQATQGQMSITFIIMLGMLLIQQGIYQYKIQSMDQQKSFWSWVVTIAVIVVLLLGGLFAMSVF